jgi:uncharacterized MAPEG superfamily protein
MDTAGLPMSPMLTWLGWSVVLLLVQVVLQASLASLELGTAYTAGPHDEERKPKNVYAGRADRALKNLLETYPAFVALALALALTAKTGGSGATGAQIWFWARIVYLPLYLLGVPYVRTVAWAISVVGLVMMLFALLG